MIRQKPLLICERVDHGTSGVILDAISISKLEMSELSTEQKLMSPTPPAASEVQR